ncbi:winged helix-turn-helix transcriptional regulator [Sphingomonas histidinilytica]|uniref:Lrp/AsnC family transcriptional regulator n=1 Tax=Rhizorhabdus histidinilytica TaxID=439228 RepID=A0A1T5EM71_9SPHN|nr:Lrp/AsnC family transcriptional regulator [Rhizorhabdus histidinilytica]MBO9376739.1 winged helix-turn-helix transcriptional regulator [Rhizorhabdus histidinilytica]QEH76817.1 Lrp/AsnC family transcriptional regulator [Sphingomonas sp. C8-2]SKB84986.1 Lrp/AsnC family transcriptional regulator [Rhizorhabdus histidinilytica]
MAEHLSNRLASTMSSLRKVAEFQPRAERPAAIALDAIDKTILCALQEDGSLSISELADRLGMTPPPCWRRVRRLRDAGVLKRQIWLVDPDAIGLHVMLYATVKLATHNAEEMKAFKEEVQKLPEVLECSILLGRTDVILKMIVPDISQYESFFYQKLTQLPGVREVITGVVMTRVKEASALPVL